MRCPECQQRNSVAARACKFCGVKFQRKPAKMGVKIAIGVAALAVAGTIWMGVFVPRLTDPGERLSEAAKRMAQGPKTLEDAQRIKSQFSDAIKELLLKHGTESSAALTKRLQQSLPSSPFEVHVVDLPKNLKLVEIDTLLQTTDFLVMKSGSGDAKVFPLPEFEVFDDARMLSDQAGPVLVLLGHSAGQMPHRPLIRTYALLPEDLVDDTDKMVPLIKGDGQARFARGTDDILAEISLASAADTEKITFVPAIKPEQVLRQRLIWKDARFVSEVDKSDMTTVAFLMARESKPANELLKVEVQRRGFIISDAKGNRYMFSCKQQGAQWMASGPPIPRGGPTNPVAALNPPQPDQTTQLQTAAHTQTQIATNTTAATDFAGVTAANSSPANSKPEEKPVKEPEKTQSPPAEKPVKVAVAAKPAPDRNPPQPDAKPAGTGSGASGAARIAGYLSSPNVNLRSGPGTNAAAIDEIPRGASIQILGQENGWYRVSYGGKQGFVYGALVDVKGSANANAAAAASSNSSTSSQAGGGSYTTAVVTRSSTVRDDQRRNLGRSTLGDRVVIMSGVKNNKYKVQLSDGRIGWVDKTALDVKVETPPDFVP